MAPGSGDTIAARGIFARGRGSPASGLFVCGRGSPASKPFRAQPRLHFILNHSTALKKIHVPGVTACSCPAIVITASTGVSIS